MLPCGNLQSILTTDINITKYDRSDLCSYMKGDQGLVSSLPISSAVLDENNYAISTDLPLLYAGYSHIHSLSAVAKKKTIPLKDSRSIISRNKTLQKI